MKIKSKNWIDVLAKTYRNPIKESSVTKKILTEQQLKNVNNGVFKK